MICTKDEGQSLKGALFWQACAQQLIIESMHLKQSRYNHVQEQEAIRRRFGLATRSKESRDTWIIYYKRIFLFHVGVLCLFYFTGLEYIDFQESYIMGHIFYQLFDGIPIIVEGIKLLREQNREYEQYQIYETEGLIFRQKSMIQKKESKLEIFLKYSNYLKTFLFKLHNYLVIGYGFFSYCALFYTFFANQQSFDLIQFIAKQLNIEQVPQIIIAFCEIHIFIVILYIGNQVMQKKSKRINRLYENVTKEQDKLAIEGCKSFGAMIYCSIIILSITYFDSVWKYPSGKLLSDSIKMIYRMEFKIIFGIILIYGNKVVIEKLYKNKSNNY